MRRIREWAYPAFLFASWMFVSAYAVAQLATVDIALHAQPQRGAPTARAGES